MNSTQKFSSSDDNIPTAHNQSTNIQESTIYTVMTDRLSVLDDFMKTKH
jgi:hypothetical protein